MAIKEKNLSTQKISKPSNVSSKKIGIVVSEWNEEITGSLYEGTFNSLTQNGIQKEHIFSLQVPGSFELSFGA